jgi:transposase-like protein
MEYKTFVGALNETSDSVTSHGSVASHTYKCKICNRTFNSHQAYGGHMSSHSKIRKKNQQG